MSPFFKQKVIQCYDSLAKGNDRSEILAAIHNMLREEVSYICCSKRFKKKDSFFSNVLKKIDDSRKDWQH